VNTRFFTFSDFHGKHPDAGSTHIRVNQLIKYWPEAARYKFGENPDVLVFQKVYITPDYHFPKHFPGIKILDICDPDWLGAMTSVKETVDAMDAIVCPTEALAKFLRQLTDKPVVVIPDRFDTEILPQPREHTKEAVMVVWFGYRHNAEGMRHAMPLINQLGLNLLVVSDDDPMIWQWLPRGVGESYRAEHYQFVKYSEDNIYKILQNADFAVLPEGSRPVDKFKSNNKTIKAILAGLPVAKTADDVRELVSADKRREYLLEYYAKAKKEYDVINSVNQYQDLIKEIAQQKQNA
jgi:hypothetical protein